MTTERTLESLTRDGQQRFARSEAGWGVRTTHKKMWLYFTFASEDDAKRWLTLNYRDPSGFEIIFKAGVRR